MALLGGRPEAPPTANELVAEAPAVSTPAPAEPEVVDLTNEPEVVDLTNEPEVVDLTNEPDSEPPPLGSNPQIAVQEDPSLPMSGPMSDREIENKVAAILASEQAGQEYDLSSVRRRDRRRIQARLRIARNVSSPMVLGAGKENAEDRFPTTLGARACDLAYRMLERNRLANVQQIQKELKELRKTIGNWTLEVKYSDKNMITLSQGQLLLIAHRGTDTSGRRTTRDVGSDLALAVGAEGTNKEFQIRLDRTTNIIQANPNKTILCTGHSLGGTTINYCLAKSAYIRKRLGFCRTFNAGASPFVSKVSAATKKKLDPLVRHHRINGDVVSASFLVNTPFGKVKTKDPTSSSTANYLRYVPGVVGLAANATLALDAHALTHWF